MTKNKNKRLKIIYLLKILSLQFLFIPFVSFADIVYQPLEPTAFPDTITRTTTLGNFLAQVFQMGLAIAAALAVVMIVWGGVEIMLSETPFGKTNGKEKIWNAIWGLLLALVSWLILFIINPQILDWSSFRAPVDDTPAWMYETPGQSDEEEQTQIGGATLPSTTTTTGNSTTSTSTDYTDGVINERINEINADQARLDAQTQRVFNVVKQIVQSKGIDPNSIQTWEHGRNEGREDYLKINGQNIPLTEDEKTAMTAAYYNRTIEEQIQVDENNNQDVSQPVDDEFGY